jgi:hypothetical protein
MSTRKNAVKPMTSALVALLLSAWVPGANADASGKPVEASGKALTMGENQAVAEKFKFNAEPLKKTYKINEPIRLKLNGDKDYYLYLYSMNEDGDAVQLFPNKKQKNNHFVAGRTYVMPGGDSQVLRADKGNTTERLMVVASLKKLDFNYENFESSGDYYTGKGDFLKKQFMTKDIRWGDAASETGESASIRDNVTRTLSLKISNQRYVETDRNDDVASVDGVVLLSADKKIYNVGDSMRIMYGSSVDGVVTLAYEYEDGARQVLQKTKVKAGELKSIKAVAEAPGGKHTLLAWMGSGANKVAEADDYYDEDDVGSKDIRLGGPVSGQPSKEVTRFVIQVNE